MVPLAVTAEVGGGRNGGNPMGCEDLVAEGVPGEGHQGRRHHHQGVPDWRRRKGTRRDTGGILLDLLTKTNNT